MNTQFSQYVNDQYNQFVKSIRTKYFFYNTDNQNNSIDFLTIRNKQTTWIPPKASAGIESYLSNVKQLLDLNTYKLSKLKKKVLTYSPPVWFLEAVKSIKNNKDIIITNADKNMGVAVVKTSDYIKEGLRQLNDSNTYQQLENKPNLNQSWAKLRSILNSSHQLFMKDKYGRYKLDKNKKIEYTKLAKYLLQMQDSKELRYPIFYMLMKVHKTPIAGRPIVSSINSITYHASKYIDHCLQPMLKYINSYIQSSQQLIAEIEISNHFPNNCVILCADIDSLYPNIPIKEGLEYFSNALQYHKSRHPTEFAQLNIDLIVALMEWVLTNNYFNFGALYYKQLNGTAMGTPAAVVFACLFLDEVEREVQSWLTFEPIFYKRFIDDLFGVFENREQAEEFILIFNNILPTIHCSTYTISDRDGVFLDLFIFKSFRFQTTNQFDVKIYQKPQNKYLYLPPNSFHPKAVFKSYISAELDRYRTYCNNDEDYKEISDLFYTRLIARGYNKMFLDPIFNKERSRQVLVGKLLERYILKENTVKKTDIPILFKTAHTPQSKLLNISKCLKLTTAAIFEPRANSFFNNRNPIKCFSNPPALGSYFTKVRNSLHSLESEQILNTGSISPT